MYSKFKILSVLITLKIIFKYTKNGKCENKHHFHFSLKLNLELRQRTAQEKENDKEHTWPKD